MTQGRGVLVRHDRLVQRLEQRHQALAAVGQRPGRYRQPPFGHPRREAVERAVAGVALEQEARPHADAVERVGEQPRHRRRRDLHWRGRALAGATKARPADHALVGLDLDLDEGGFLGAVGCISLTAPCADALFRRRGDLFGALLKPGPLGAAVAGRAGLLAALAPCARLLLLLALAPVEPLRHHGPARAQLGKLGFQRFDPTPRSLRGPVQTGVLLAQPLDHGLLTPRPLEHGAQLSGLVEGQLRQRRPGRAQLGKPGLQLLFPAPGQLERVAQPVHLVGQRLGPGLDVPQVLQLSVEPQVLTEQLLGGRRDGPRPLLLTVHLLVQIADRFAPVGQILGEPLVLRAQRLDRGLQLPRLERGCLRCRAGAAGMRPGGVLRDLPLRQNLVQSGNLVAQSHDRVVFVRASDFPDELPQARHLRLQGRHLLDRTAEFLRLLLGLAQPAPTGLEARLPRSGIATRGHLRPTQVFAARFRRICPTFFAFRTGVCLLIERLPVVRLVLGPDRGGRPHPPASLVRRQIRGSKISVENRHALDDSAWRIMLPAL